MPIRKAQSELQGLKLALSLWAAFGVAGHLAVRAQDAEIILRETFKAGGTEAASKGQYAEAEKLLNAALSAAEKTPQEYAQLHEIIKTLAEVKIKQNKLDNAEQLLKQACEMLQHYAGKKAPEVADVLYTLGLLHIKQQKYQQAELELGDALSIYENVNQSSNISIANSAYAAGVNYYLSGQYQKAEEPLKQALSIYDSVHGEHEDFLDGLVYLALADHAAGKSGAAQMLSKHALELAARIKGKDSKYVAISLYLLARLDKAEGQIAQAASLLRNAEDICNRLPSQRKPRQTSHVSSTNSTAAGEFSLSLKEYLLPSPPTQINTLAIMKEYLAVVRQLALKAEVKRLEVKVKQLEKDR